jgi:hypothetical protein
VRPKVLIKGGDYRHEQVVGRELVEADGGEVVLIDLCPASARAGSCARRAPRRLLEAKAGKGGDHGAAALIGRSSGPPALEQGRLIARFFSTVMASSSGPGLPGIFELARFWTNELRRPIVVVTNQSGIGRGYLDENAYADLTRWMCERFEAERTARRHRRIGAIIRGANPSPECSCRLRRTSDSIPLAARFWGIK